MNKKRNKIGAKTKKFFSLLFALVLLLGCAAHRKPDEGVSGSKRITNMTVSKRSDSIVLTIEGDRSLTYTAEKLAIPMGVVLKFPDTTLELPGKIYSPPDNAIISSIKISEKIEDRMNNARIFVAFKKDTTYELAANGRRLTVIFPATGVIPDVARPGNKLVENKKDSKPEPQKDAEPGIAQHRRPVANYLKTVTATTLKDKISIEVKADGTITNYKSFILDSPPRIVFDLYNLKSPYKGEQTISVASPWVQRIRHFAHPDKVRLVLETQKSYLSKYSAFPGDIGLLIVVGNTHTATGTPGQNASDTVSGTRQTELSWEEVAGADAYNVYWGTTPGVTKHNGNKISNVHSPAVIKNLKSGVTYYFVVTTVKGSKESSESEEFSFTPGK